MASLNTDNIKKLKRGEIAGYAATAVCALALVYFIIAFTIAQVLDIPALRLVTLVVSPVIMVIGVGVSAFCNLKYNALSERVISRYVQAVMLENAQVMHPEREKLAFKIYTEGNECFLSVNGYREAITFDFSAFGKISAFRRAQIISAIADRLSSTFFKLHERGAKYSRVSYTVNTPSKTGKPVDIIAGGAPEPKSYKAYLKAQ